ncbi:conserved hypothetical protein [Luminiphilus syltensis NOR5-1B]|uniref:Integral membrane protein n=1 Tax=Luminiphilus syltensis NOR5-1B TaxID=565045 RepID=B8KQK7_9GAMM|nr:DUF2244 domain-containing protein [Luminiphilus syltensis]EED35279.1 conserved hypothetical protein [Luminiphilus syltensis NOR5-1B]
MIHHSEAGGAKIIIAKPNHSSSWRHNLWALVAIAVPSLAAAIGFTLLGAWPILPLAGLELGCLGGALYYVNWKLQYRHVITLTKDRIKIDKGHYAPRRTWRLPREQTRLAVTPEAHPWDGPALAIHSREHHVAVGEFLNRDDALALMKLLKAELRTGTHSAQTRLQL